MARSSQPENRQGRQPGADQGGPGDPIVSGQEEMWVSHTIAAIGLSLNVFQPWPLLSMSDIGAAGIYQPIGDTNGIVFVRYGPEETVDKYTERLGGMFTAVSVVSDTTVTVADREARRVTLCRVT